MRRAFTRARTVLDQVYNMGPTDGVTSKSPPSLTGIGRQLSTARKKWGLSVEEVAKCLNLSTAIIEALEQGDCERLPGATFVRGYLRAYAKLLKLDHEAILTGIRPVGDQDCEIQLARVPLRYSAHRPNLKKHGSVFVRGLLIGGVLVGLMGIAVSQLPGLSVNKLLATLGLSYSVSPEGQSEEQDN